MTISYTLNGVKWQQSPITWSFADFNYAVDAGRLVFSHAITDTFQSLVQQAVQEWSAVSGLVLNQVADSNTVDIRIGFAYLNTATTGTVGLTQYSYSGAFLRPDVLLSVEDPSQLPVVYVDSVPTYQNSSVQFYQDVLHELGHALGLGHSTDPSSVMFPTLTAADRDLDASDVAGIHAIYSPATTPPSPPSVRAAGAHTQYNIANDYGSFYLQDLVASRDGTRILPGSTQISFTDGTGVFDSTGNAEEVARLYQAALGRAPDVGGLNGWTAQINAHVLGIDAVALGFINSAEFSRNYGALSNSSFVTQLYQNVLHRAPDNAGAQGWINQLNGGASKAQVLIGFSDSLENKLNTRGSIGDPHMDEAYRLYQAALNRTPDTPGLGGWTAQLDSGVSPLQVAEGFVGSNEFARLFAGLNAKGFVDQLYQNVLHRAPDSAGEQGWINQLNGGVSKAQVLLGFSNWVENRLNTSQATHDSWVFVHS